MTLDNEEISEIYETHIENMEREDRQKSVISKFSTWQIIFLIVVLLILYQLVFVKQTIDKVSGLLLAVGIIIVVWFSAKKEEEMPVILSDKRAKAILYKELEWKQNNTGEIPRGTIWVGPYCKLRRFSTGVDKGKPWKWDIFFEVHKTRGGVELYSAELDPYSGMIIAIKDRSEGFTGKEAADVTYIRPREDIWRERYGYFKKRKYPPEYEEGESS